MLGIDVNVWLGGSIALEHVDILGVLRHAKDHIFMDPHRKIEELEFESLVISKELRIEDYDFMRKEGISLSGVAEKVLGKDQNTITDLFAVSIMLNCDANVTQVSANANRNASGDGDTDKVVYRRTEAGDNVGTTEVQQWYSLLRSVYSGNLGTFREAVITNVDVDFFLNTVGWIQGYASSNKDVVRYESQGTWTAETIEGWKREMRGTICFGLTNPGMKPEFAREIVSRWKVLSGFDEQVLRMAGWIEARSPYAGGCEGNTKMPCGVRSCEEGFRGIKTENFEETFAI